MDEPLIRLGNVTGAGVAVAAYLLGFPRVAMFLGITNGLDIIGRQVSPDYRAFAATVNGADRHVAGLGLIGNFIPGVERYGVTSWRYQGKGVPWLRSIVG